MDRRVRRTRRQMRDALLALVMENGYESVTIQQITDKADLSRATFYLHYKEKDVDGQYCRAINNDINNSLISLLLMEGTE